MKVDNDLVEKIRAVRRKLATDGPVRVRSGGDYERVSIGRSDGDLLRDLVLAERAHTVIEIGLAYAASALAIAEALVANGAGSRAPPDYRRLAESVLRIWMERNRRSWRLWPVFAV